MLEWIDEFYPWYKPAMYYHQDDSHIFCTKSQIKQVIFEVLEFVDTLLKLFDFKYEIEASTNQKAIW